jgi:hypothetical protein
MSYNILAYFIYLPFTFILTIWVGRDLHQKGVGLLTNALGDSPLVKVVNQFLLLGYYLLNIGYAAVCLSFFPSISNFKDLIDALAFRLGFILFSLALIHYFNILIIHHYPQWIKKFIHI